MSFSQPSPKRKRRWLLWASLIAIAGIIGIFIIGINTEDASNPPVSAASDGDSGFNASQTPLTASELKEETATAVKSVAVPGVIVCADFDSVNIAFEQYVQYYGDQQARSQYGTKVKEETELFRGKALPPPDIAPLGCSLIPPGIDMHFRMLDSIPVIAAQLPNGTVVRGVTSPRFL